MRHVSHRVLVKCITEETQQGEINRMKAVETDVALLYALFEYCFHSSGYQFSANV